MRAKTRLLPGRRVLALVSVAILVGTVGSYSLQNTGIATFTITPAPGLSATGKVADFVPESFVYTRPNGAASIQAGVQAGRIDVAAGFANSLKLDMAWLNPNDADQVLNNPNASIWVGFYYPIYQGTCTGVPLSVSATRATMTYSSESYCTRLDENATGKLVHEGKLTMTRELVAGTLLMAQSDAGTAACDVNILNTTWCRPAGANANKNVVFVGISIVAPGGKPQGQQNNIDDLKFYFSVRGQIS